MNYVVEFTEFARADFFEILGFIAQDSPQNALKFIDTLQERIETTLSTFPNGGSIYKSFRYLSFGRYVVVYHVQEAKKKVFVHLVSEGHRQWRVVLDDRLQHVGYSCPNCRQGAVEQIAGGSNCYGISSCR